MILYGIACFFEALTMALGINKGRKIYNILSSVFAFVAICLQLHGFSESFAVSGYLLSFAHAAVIFINGVLTERKVNK